MEPSVCLVSQPVSWGCSNWSTPQHPATHPVHWLQFKLFIELLDTNIDPIICHWIQSVLWNRVKVNNLTSDPLLLSTGTDETIVGLFSNTDTPSTALWGLKLSLVGLHLLAQPGATMSCSSAGKSADICQHPSSPPPPADQPQHLSRKAKVRPDLPLQDRMLEG